MVPQKAHKSVLPRLPRLAWLVVLLSLLFSACQSNSPAPTATGAAATPSPVPRTATPSASATPSPQPTPTLPPYLALEANSLRGTQVDFWHPWRGDLAALVKDAASEFNRSNEWGLQVRVREMNSAGSLADAFQAIDQEGLPAPNSPEVLVAPPDQLAAWLAAQRVVSLTGYLNHPQWGLTPGEIEAFNPVFWQQDQLQSAPGQVDQVGIPVLRTGRVLFYNQTWAKELGFDQPPRTTAAFQAQACAAAEANNAANDRQKNGTGGWLIDNDALTILSWLTAFDSQVLPAKEGQDYNFQSSEAEAALSYLRALLEQGCAWEGRSLTPYEYFSQRYALFYAGTLQDLALQTHTNQRLNSQDDWTVLAFPAQSGPGVVYTSGYSYGLAPSSPQGQMAGWLFIRWLSQPRYQARLAQVYPSFPVTTAVISEVSDYQQHEPWSWIMPLLDRVQPAPGLPSWQRVHGVLEDAAWQVFRLPADQMKFVLPQLDEITKELLSVPTGTPQVARDIVKWRDKLGTSGRRRREAPVWMV